MNRALQVIVALGVVIVLVSQSIQALPLQPQQGYSLLVMLLALLALALTFALLLPKQLGQIVRHPNLLVPLGLLVLFEAGLRYMASISFFQSVFTPSRKIEFAKLSFPLSFAVVASYVAAVAYAAWTTALILNTVADGNDDLRAGLRGLRWFVRVLVVLVIGWGVMFAVLALAMVFATVSMILTLIAIAAFSLGWNMFTAALLPAVLDPRRGLLEALGRSFQISRTRLSKWWAPVLAQLLLLGFATLVHVSFTSIRNDRRGHTTTHHQTKTNWSVNAFWTGGYENDCRWHTALMSAVEAPKVAPVTTLLALLFGVLAIGVKLRVVDGYLPLPVTAVVDSPTSLDPAETRTPRELSS